MNYFQNMVEILADIAIQYTLFVLVSSSVLVQDGIVGRQEAAVLGQTNWGRSAALVRDVGIVVRRAEHLNLADSRAVLVGEILVHAGGERVGLDLAGAGVAHGNLDELAGGNGLVSAVLGAASSRADAVGASGVGVAAVAAALHGVEGHVEAAGNLPEGVAVEGVVQTRPADQTVVGAGAVNDTRGPVWIADLSRDDDGLADMRNDRHINHFSFHDKVSGCAIYESTQEGKGINELKLARPISQTPRLNLTAIS